MEVKQSGIGPPSGDGLVHSFVVQRAFNVQPAFQVVSSANIVPGKKVGSAKSPKQNILRRPSSNASQFQ